MNPERAAVNTDENDIVLVPRLLSVAKSVRQLFGIVLAEIDVVVGQDQFLLCFERGEARSVAELAAMLSVRPSTVSKMVDILERKGWAVRESDQHDARKVRVRLSELGVATRHRVNLVWQKLDAEIAQSIGQGAETFAALERIDGVLSKRLARLR